MNNVMKVSRRSYQVRMSPDMAQQVLFVPHYETTDPASPAPEKRGYQRPPMDSRIPKIARWIVAEENEGLCPPILVSVRLRDGETPDDYLKFVEAEDATGLIAHFGAKASALVDGQHRAKGFFHAYQEDEDFRTSEPWIPMLLIFDLPYIREATLFNDVNANQRKLPKALIETTKGTITEAGERTHSQAIREIALALAFDGDSVWGKDEDGNMQVNMTGARDPDKPITFEGIRRSTANMFPSTLLTRLEKEDPELPKRLAKQYWRLVSQACSAAWNGQPLMLDNGEFEEVRYRLKDLVGVASLAKLGGDIILSQIESGNPEKMSDLVEKLSAVNWERDDKNPWMRSQAGFAGQKVLYTMLHEFVYLDKEPGEPED